MTESRDSRLVNLLGVSALALSDRIREATEAAAGLTGAAPVALVALHQFLGGRSTEDLAQATGLTHSGAVRLVDRLVQAGLVERLPGRDGRSLSVVLTRAGRALSHKISEARAQAIESSIDGFGRDDRRVLVNLLETLVATLTAQRLDDRVRGRALGAWLCRMCDFSSCGRPQGRCPAAKAVEAHAVVTGRTTWSA